jgi:hypothetical protein
MNDDISNLIGMSGLLNNSEIDNSIKPKTIEKELIQNTLELDTFKNDELLNYNPINEYNSVFESLIDQSSNGDNTENNDAIYDDNNDNNDQESNDNKDEYYNINNNYDNKDNEIDNLINYSSNKMYDQNSFAYKLTEEQQNQKFVDNVLSTNNSNNYNYNIEDENREDLKITLLEKIDNLTEELEDEGI